LIAAILHTDVVQLVRKRRLYLPPPLEVVERELDCVSKLPLSSDRNFG